MSDQIDPGQYQEELGRVETYDIGRITRRDARRYARAVEDDNPLFHDVSAARAAGFADLVVPPNYLPAIIDPSEGTTSTELREDGLDPSLFPIRMPEQAVLMGGGQELQLDRYVVVGEDVRKDEEFVDIYQRDADGAGTLTFLERASDFFVQLDDANSREPVLHCQETLIIGSRQ